MTIDTSLVNHLLIAMPSLKEPMFEKTVVYICEHNSEGAVGLIINRPTEHHLSLVFDQLHIESIHQTIAQSPLLFGGPVQPERGFVLHRPIGGWKSSVSFGEDVTVTTSNDIIRAIATNTGPKDVLVTLGYSGWGKNQLEQELITNAWLVCPFKAEIMFEVPFDLRWEYAGLSIGVKMHQLTDQIGHA